MARDPRPGPGSGVTICAVLRNVEVVIIKKGEDTVRRLPSAPVIYVAVLTLAAGAAWHAVARADVIDLTTGERVRGTIKGTTSAGIVIEVDGRERTIEERLVRGIAFEPAPRRSARSRAAPGATTPAAPQRTESTSGGASAAPPRHPPPATGRDDSLTRSEPEPPKPPSATEPAPPPPASPRSPLVLARVSPATLREAVQALTDLRAFVGDGVSESDYAARAGEARRHVDRYLADPEDGRTEIKNALASATRLYSFAASASSVYAARGDFSVVGRDPAIAECPRLGRAIEQAAAHWGFRAGDPAFAGLIAGTEGLKELWACAADKLGEAETLIAGQKP